MTEETASKEQEPKAAAPEEADRYRWLDRWWFWALLGLGLAALIGLLHVTSQGTAAS